jgi:hypothetical protein
MANSSGELTIDYFDKVFYPAVGAVDGELQKPVGTVCDAFGGHFEKVVKERNALHRLLA